MNFGKESKVHNNFPMIVNPISKLNKKSYTKFIVDECTYFDYEQEEDLHYIDLLNFNKPFKFVYKDYKVKK